jgi:hypothetical protein
VTAGDKTLFPYLSASLASIQGHPVLQVSRLFNQQLPEFGNVLNLNTRILVLSQPATFTHLSYLNTMPCAAISHIVVSAAAQRFAIPPGLDYNPANPLPLPVADHGVY